MIWPCTQILTIIIENCWRPPAPSTSKKKTFWTHFFEHLPNWFPHTVCPAQYGFLKSVNMQHILQRLCIYVCLTSRFKGLGRTRNFFRGNYWAYSTLFFKLIVKGRMLTHFSYSQPAQQTLLWPVPHLHIKFHGQKGKTSVYFPFLLNQQTDFWICYTT